MRTILIAGLLLGLVQTTCAAPPATAQDVDTKLQAIFKDAKIPGAQVALVENGRLTYLKSYGHADVAKKVPVTDDTVFRAGSISKSFTSIAIMTAVEDGKLRSTASSPTSRPR
jgi:CubicO group peptidase (beta-lactamase class C family)